MLNHAITEHWWGKGVSRDVSFLRSTCESQREGISGSKLSWFFVTHVIYFLLNYENMEEKTIVYHLPDCYESQHYLISDAYA